MLKRFHYSLFDKFLFYFSYFFYKCIIPLEVKKPRLRLWLYEMIYSLAKFKDYTISLPYKSKDNIIITKFGKFRIRANTSDAANVSPAFERRDQNYLLKLINKLCHQKKRILFLDVGGDLGSYTVLVGNRFRHENVKIKTFEPIEDSCTLINENIALNEIEKNCEVFGVGLLNEDNPSVKITSDIGTPGSSTMKESSAQNTQEIEIKAQKLDTVLADKIDDYDAVVFKIDVEGVEKEVLLGAERIINSGREMYVLLEDFIEPRIIPFMEEKGWAFLAKVTSYNSWWYFSAGN